MKRFPFLIFPIALLLTFPALAQESAPSAEEVEALRATVQEAMTALEAGEAGKAVELLEAVRGENTPAPILGLLGAVYVEAGRPADALEVLEPLAQDGPANPAVLYNAGRAALTLGQREKAEGYFERSVGLERGTPAARELGILRGAEGRLAEAYALLKPWAEANPDDVEARRAAALCAIELRRLPEAEKLLSDLPQDQPGIRLLWGRLLHLQGDAQAAVATLEPLLEGEPTAVDMEARISLAESYLSLGEAAKAVVMLQGRARGRPLVALQLAKARYQNGDAEGAVETLQPLVDHMLSEEGRANIQDNPKLSGDLALEYGRYLIASGKREEALSVLEIATELKPAEKQAWQLYGQALAAAGQREEAQKALQRFQKLAQEEVPSSEREVQARQDIQDPVAAQLRQATDLLQRGKHEEALGLLRREVEITPDDVRPRLAVIGVLLGLERAEEALAAAEAALRAIPENADLLYQRGVTKMAVRDLEGAETDFRHTLELAPEHTAAMNDLAVLLMVAGDNGSARSLLERVLEINPNDANAKANLDRLARGG